MTVITYFGKIVLTFFALIAGGFIVTGIGSSLNRFGTQPRAETVAEPARVDALAIAMIPQFARKVGEINAAVGRYGFKLRETEQVLANLPMYYLNQKRDDLLGQSVAASNAFNDRYKKDPIKACDQARSTHWLAFK
jgi:hypothetical protein